MQEIHKHNANLSRIVQLFQLILTFKTKYKTQREKSKIKKLNKYSIIYLIN